MNEQKNILPDTKTYLFDKKTGEKFSQISVSMVNEIKHYRMLSEISGKMLLLSEDGIKLRFADTPDQGEKYMSDLFRRLTSSR